MSQKYVLYLQRHKAFVQKGFDWLKTNMPWLFEGRPSAAWQTEFEHDASKSNPDEYEAYDAYFYGGNRSHAIVEAFNRAWLLHIHRNPHHWQHWVLINDDPGEGEVLLEMPYHDMKLTQQFAVLNRKAMVDVILNGMGLTAVDIFTTIHNYIDTDAMILRKGSVSAKKGEKLLIPINMRDGSLICIGTGNEDWNCSAPHGAGRLMSRRAALNTLSMEEFQNEMKGIYTTCVVPDTLDESPMAYKSIDEIVSQIGPTAIIVERIRPVYNFKASD